jgi:Cu/Ag efflux protein CusF
MKRFLVFAMLGALAWACQAAEEPPASQPQIGAPEGAGQVNEYPLNGEVVSVDKDAKTAVIKHDEIPGFMAAMTMSYPIPEQTDIDKITAGDRITATVYDEPAESKMWLGEINVTPNP